MKTSEPDRGCLPASSAISTACAQVGDALSEGDPELRTAINGLATAYARVFESNRKNIAAARAVAMQSRKVSAICPGNAS